MTVEKRKLKKSDFRPAREWIDALPPDKLAEIEANAARIVADLHLAEMRKAMKVTQAALAGRSGMTQGEISRVERAPETAQIRTLERYVAGLGGSLNLVADFPDGTRAVIAVKHGRPIKSKMAAEPPAIGARTASDDEATAA